MHEVVERGFKIDCSRCSMDHFVAATLLYEACNEFVRLGWTVEYPRVFCPLCNAERKALANAR